MDHPARARVAEIMVARIGPTGEERTRGSGYLVSPGWVLTAHHVVRDAASVGVWLGVPPELVSEEGVGVDPGRVLAVPAADLALLPLGGEADDPPGEPALFGRLDREPGPPVPVAAAGCPRFKLRPAPGRPGVLLRELDYAIGSVAALSDAKTGRFAFAVDVAPGPDTEPGERSPWEGMSGAAVWASGRLIGVVGQHHPREGLATLTVCPVEQLFGSVSEDQLEAWRAALPQLPATAGNLWLATPPTFRQIGVARARRAAEALAPRVLIGRSAEQAALEAFTISGARWRWIQGDAFAGKTALLAWFALHPPDSVDIAACFLRRASGEDTAEYALDVLTRQLALLADRGSYLPPPFPSERSNDFADLLEEAARACADRDRRLVVLIDGLDEYDPTTTSLDLADWLPDHRTLPDQAMLLAASRAGADVRLPSEHPLLGHLQHITASEAATEIQQTAHAELDRAARAPGGFLLPLLCCLAVAGSGLTASDMCALLKRRGRDADVSEIEAQLSNSLGRSLRRLPNPEGTGAQVYAFAHDTLLTEARSRFASDLPTYDDLIDAWASEYAHDNWPIGTPQYLLAPYTRELARRARDPATPDAHRGKAMSGALDRLSALARSPRRHALLLRSTGSDYAAISEIWAAQNLIADQEALDLQALVELAAYQHAVSIHCRSIPPGLPVVWARLGRFDHAEALARTIADSGTQARVLADVAAAARAGDPDRAYRLAADAEALARALTTYPDLQAEVLASLTAAAARAGDPDRAYRLAADAEASVCAYRLAADARASVRDLTALHRVRRALTDLAAAIVQAGDPDRAEALVRTTTDPDIQIRVLASLTAAAARAGDRDRAYRLAADAEALTRTITDSRDQGLALGDLAAAIAQAGDPDRAQAMARTITDPDIRARAIVSLAAAAARDGDRDRAYRLAADAEAFTRTIIDPDVKTRALRDLAIAAAQAGDPDRAQAMAGTITDLYAQGWALADVVITMAQAGDPDRAEALARTITPPYSQTQALVSLATAAARAGDLDRAYRLAADAPAGDPNTAEAFLRLMRYPDSHYWTHADLATAIAQAGDPDRAEALARTIPGPNHQAETLAKLAGAAAQDGDQDRAARLAADAETLTRTITDPDTQALMLAHLATAAAQAGDADRAHRLAADAETLARAITDPEYQDEALANLVPVIAQVGDPDRAEALARTITDPVDQDDAHVSLAAAIAGAGDADRAEALVRTIADPHAQARALANLVPVIARVGDPGRAAALARTITDPHAQARALVDLATAAAQAGDLDAAGHLLAPLLIMDLAEIWWLKAVSQFFPSVIGAAWDILADAYTTLRPGVSNAY
jgi:hypothetical protein